MKFLKTRKSVALIGAVARRGDCSDRCVRVLDDHCGTGSGSAATGDSQALSLVTQ